MFFYRGAKADTRRGLRVSNQLRRVRKLFRLTFEGPTDVPRPLHAQLERQKRLKRLLCTVIHAFDAHMGGAEPCDRAMCELT